LLFADRGDSPYWALRDLIKRLGGGVSDVPVVDETGEEWTVSLSYQQSGLEPRVDDDVDELHEYRLDADGAGERKVRLLIQPRLDWDEPSRRPQSVPASLGEATNVRAEQCSNVGPTETRQLVPQLLAGLCRAGDLDWNPSYFTGDLHEYSSITALEVYVRLNRDMARKVIGGSGVFRRLFDLVATEEGSKVVFSADNTEIVGYNHQLRFDQAAAATLFSDAPGRRHGFQLKHYHPKHVRGDDRDDDPLYHPKVGVLFKKSLNDGAVPFNEVEALLTELEEDLLNVLAWSDVPTDATTPPYVPDDHFSAAQSDRGIELFGDPTPEIERDQDSILVRTLCRLEDSDLDVLDRLVADGGETDVAAIAGDTGWSVRTVYRALDRVGELVDVSNGAASFLSQKIREDVRQVVQRVESTVEAQARVVEDLLSIDQRDVDADARAFQRWLAEYGVDLNDDGDGPLELRARTALSLAKAGPGQFAAEVADYAARAWLRTGRDPVAIKRARLVFDDPVAGCTRSLSIGSLRQRLR
jgi:hypothetical protein